MNNDLIIEKLSLTENDLEQLKAHNVSIDSVAEQLKFFENGIETIELERACTINDGIIKLSDAAINNFSQLFENEIAGKTLCKFVPASGAATRMFKDLLFIYNNNVNVSELLNDKTKADTEIAEAVKTFAGLKKFSFYNDLKTAMENDGFDIENLISLGDYNPILEYLLFDKGLNLSNLPKGLIKFHSYDDKTRTAFEEHLTEAAVYACNKNKQANVHFTISPEHFKSISEHINDVLNFYTTDGIEINVEYSTQKNSTDTIALDKNNKLARDIDGKILFRPSGHGALLENLNSTDADIIFIKNIDNVLPDSLKEDTYTFKRVLGGALIDIQTKTFNYLNKIEEDKIDDKNINELINFAEDELQLYLPEKFFAQDLEYQKKYLFDKLNRPIRICGMVKNEGEPGGGPFWVKEQAGRVSKQIIEAAQINFESESQKEIFESSTHFNPVDIVCAVKNYKGIKFNLPDYRNPNLGIMGAKTYNGESIRVLELPGLWNGGMHNWITLFLEVPLTTFNPVKKINDLLKQAHQ
ncbi:MAG: DUF4301 family protein [Ignavibacteriae bacterium]|nr:DUF4301 family protein [Ignavibacteriota bacterium]NOG99950.1 DUF4301 family protein [Ignavibacteriota bacterium]